MLLRLADELDITHDRVDIETVKNFRLPTYEALYWWLHYYLDLALEKCMLTFDIVVNETDFDCYAQKISEQIFSEFEKKNRHLLDILAEHGFYGHLMGEPTVEPDTFIEPLPGNVKFSILCKIAKVPLEKLTAEVGYWLSVIGSHVADMKEYKGYIDLIVDMPVMDTSQPIVVRCVDGEITLPIAQELAQEIKNQEIFMGWAVSDIRIAPGAKKYAKENEKRVLVFSLSDVIKQVFGHYFNYLEKQVEESGISQYYVNLSCSKPVFGKDGKEVTRDKYEMIQNYIDSWQDEQGKNHLSLLGDFGSGKTWFCRWYAYQQLQRYKKDQKRQRLPLLITLREYAKSEDVRRMITDLLINEYQAEIKGGYKIFEEMNRQGKLLLIFDGFDEMARKMDWQTVVNNFWGLAQAVTPQSKVLLTCRTQYFKFSKEAQEILRGQHTGRVELIDLSTRPEFEILYLDPFNEDQILEVLRKRLGEVEGQSAFEKLGTIHELSDLATRPIMLEMISETLGEIQPREEVNSADLYRRYTNNKWITRTNEGERTFLGHNDKLFFMEELALEMYRTYHFSIHYSQFPARILQYFELDGSAEQV